MAKKKPFSAACLGAWMPEAGDSIFYGCGTADNYDLAGDSLEGIANQYAAINPGAGKIIRRADIIHNGKYLGWVDTGGVTTLPEPLSFADYFSKIKSMALENAKRLSVDNGILSQIERGNFHEIYFFSDSRCLQWYTPEGAAAVTPPLSSSVIKNISKTLDAAYSVVETAIRNGKQLVMEGQLCLF